MRASNCGMNNVSIFARISAFKQLTIQQLTKSKCVYIYKHMLPG